MAAPRVPSSKRSDLRSFTKSLLENPLVRAGYERGKADFDVARVVKRLRMGAELTQEQFARLVKLPIETLIDIETGKNAEALSAGQLAYAARQCRSRLTIDPLCPEESEVGNDTQ